MKLSGGAIWRESERISPTTLYGKRPTGGIFRGRDAVLGNFAELPKYWSKFSVDPDEYIDAGEHVVVRGVQSVTGPGGSTESRYLHLMTLSNGKIVRGEYIADTVKGMKHSAAELARDRHG